MAQENRLDIDLDELTKTRHYLHEHPELSDHEVETTKFITNKLKDLGYRIITPEGLKTGVVAELGHGHPVVALRADIDALPVQEKTGLPFASANDGVMHACGHDFHITSLLGAAKAFTKTDFNGTIRLIFQPAEETHVGAQEVMDAGGADGIDAIFGFHNKPDLGVGEVGILQGGLYAAVDQFKVTIRGKGTHAAMPEKGKDPIIALTNIVNALQTIISRNIDPHTSTVLSVTHIWGGNTWNVIPNTAGFEGTVRTYDKHARQVAREEFEQLVPGIAKAMGVEADIDWMVGPDVVKNDAKLTKIIRDETSKFATVKTPQPSNTGEDFAYFSQRIPSFFAFVGSHAKSDWHHADYVVDDAALPTGVKFFYYNTLRLLKELN